MALPKKIFKVRRTNHENMKMMILITVFVIKIDKKYVIINNK